MVVLRNAGFTIAGVSSLVLPASRCRWCTRSLENVAASARVCYSGKYTEKCHKVVLMSAIVMQTATRKQRLQRARQLVQQYVKTNISLVDELIKERRRAAVDE